MRFLSPPPEGMKAMWEKLLALAKEAKARYDAMSPEDKAAHDKAQRESFIRGMGPCEHGDYDWETCPQCLEKYRK